MQSRVVHQVVLYSTLTHIHPSPLTHLLNVEARRHTETAVQRGSKCRLRHKCTHSQTLSYREYHSDPPPNSRPVNGWEVYCPVRASSVPPLVHDARIKVEKGSHYADLWLIGRVCHGFSYQLAGDEQGGKRCAAHPRLTVLAKCICVVSERNRRFNSLIHGLNWANLALVGMR